MYTREQFSHTKARMAVELKEFSKQSERVGAIQQDLEKMCEYLYGHDFGKNDQNLYCSHCQQANLGLFDEAETFSLEITR